MKYLSWLAVAISLALLNLGCGSSAGSVENVNGGSRAEISSTYTSSFPHRDVTRNIKSVLRSVKRISSTSTYRAHYFGDRLVTLDDLRNKDLGKLATRTVTQNESVAGTAISIAQHRLNIALLTCAHVINFPDTLVEYISREDLPKDTYVSSIAVKRSQRNLLFDLPHVEEFNIIDMDVQEDLGLIQYSRKQNMDLSAPPLNLKMGDSKRLKWGSFIYIAGFPKGFPMIVRGIVSDPNRNSDGDFLTDALFNPGISGGIILASRDGFHSFEWVGMANTASADHELTLIPDPAYSGETYKSLEPYSATPVIERKTRISYGITQSIPTAKIIEFMERNRTLLHAMGLDVGNL